MRDGAIYLVACLCLGWIAVWAGENLFWTTPAPDLRAIDRPFTWAAYSVAAGVMVGLVVPGWAALGGVAVNVPVALGTGTVGAGLWLWLLWRAERG